MIRSSVWGATINVNLTSVPNASYDVYIYVWEDNNAETFSVSLEGTIALASHNSGSAGSWNKLGPFRRAITDGSINVTVQGGQANVSGIEVWTAPNPPVVSNPIVDQVAMVGENFNFTVPSNTFSDPDAGTLLTYTASIFNGSALPSWLTFNATSRTFSGTPASGNQGAFNVRVTATDGDGGSVSDVFLVTVNTGIYTLHRAINLNGSALSIDGNSWQASSGAPNFTVSGAAALANQNIALNPGTDANRATMIQSSLWGDFDVTVSSVPAGNYAIWVYSWEDDWNTTFSLSLEGTAALTNFNTGIAGTWVKHGPFLRTINDGALNLTTTGGGAVLSGIEIYSVSPYVPVTDISIAPTTLSLAPGETRQINKTITPANATNQNVNWTSSNPSVATVNATTGLVTAVAAGSATITATTVSGNLTKTTIVNVTAPATFYRAININGSALTIDGNSWQSSTGATNFSYNQSGGGVFANQGITLNPATDANRATMIRSSVWGTTINVNLTSVPNASYDVYVYVWEDNNAETFSVSLEGTVALASHNSGSAGTWNKLGPFRRAITDGSINVTVQGGQANVSGIEVWIAPNTPVVSNPIADQVAIVGENLNFTVPSNTFSDPDVGTVLTYLATRSDGSALPSWLTFNATTRTFTGTPASGNAGALSVRVRATDGDGGSLTVTTGRLVLELLIFLIRRGDHLRIRIFR
jgi:uncharacterized protein YjdB